MKIKRGIRRCYPKTQIVIESAPDIYVADMRLRSHNVRGVEISATLPLSPDGNGMMDCLHFQNPDILSVDFAIFDDNQFKRTDGKVDVHCEGCMYPTLASDKAWVAFLEIKDCKPGNAFSYKRYAQRQIFQSVKAFRKNHILSDEKMYGIVSIPRKRMNFNDTLFADPIEYRRLKHFTGILFYSANDVFIVDDLRIKPAMQLSSEF